MSTDNPVCVKQVLISTHEVTIIWTRRKDNIVQGENFSRGRKYKCLLAEVLWNYHFSFTGNIARENVVLWFLMIRIFPRSKSKVWEGKDK